MHVVDEAIEIIEQGIPVTTLSDGTRCCGLCGGWSDRGSDRIEHEPSCEVPHAEGVVERLRALVPRWAAF